MAFGLIGTLIIWTIQQFPLTHYLSSKWVLLEKLFNCRFCLGVWVFWILAILFDMNLLDGTFYVPIFSHLVTGVCMSFIMYLIGMGWNARFQILVIGDK